MINFFELFDVSAADEVDTDKIKYMYRRYSLLLHPDRTRNSQESEHLMKIINKGYSVLTNTEARNKYLFEIDPTRYNKPSGHTQERTSYDNKPMLRVCPVCNGKLTMFDMVCPKCDHDLYGSRNYQKSKIVKDWFCPQCGRPNSKDVEKCTVCGVYKITPHANAYYG